METLEILKSNLSSPIVLAFVLGLVARLIKSELSLPKDLYSSLTIYLLLAIGLKGGVELSISTISEIARPIGYTILLGCLTPVSAYFFLRKLGRFGVIDAAAIAAHYGSVSAVTFIAAVQFATAMGQPSEGFMPTLLTLLEAPGIHIALAIGALHRSKGIVGDQLRTVFHEICTSRSMILLVGGMLIGFLMGESGYEPVQPFFEVGFKGALVLFLLEMGILAGTRLGDLKKVGVRLVALGIFLPLIHGVLGAVAGWMAGLSVGGCGVLAAMTASASYIAAPPAARMTLPEANPTFYLTASLVITFPFNLIIGIPLYFRVASWLHQ